MFNNTELCKVTCSNPDCSDNPHLFITPRTEFAANWMLDHCWRSRGRDLRGQECFPCKRFAIEYSDCSQVIIARAFVLAVFRDGLGCLDILLSDKSETGLIAKKKLYEAFNKDTNFHLAASSVRQCIF